MDYYLLTYNDNWADEIDLDDAAEVESVIDVQKITEEEYEVLNRLGLLSAGFASSFIEQLFDSLDYDPFEEEVVMCDDE